MKPQDTLFRLCLLVVATLAPAGYACADAIYRWVDDDGIVHFSDRAPRAGTEVDTLRVNETNPSGYDPKADPYSILNQSGRIRDSLEQLRDRRHSLRADRQEFTEYGPSILAREPGAHYRASYYHPWIEPPPAMRPLGRTIRGQLRTLDELGLSGERPFSVNSGAHRARVTGSQGFLTAVSRVPGGRVDASARRPPRRP